MGYQTIPSEDPFSAEGLDLLSSSKQQAEQLLSFEIEKEE